MISARGPDSASGGEVGIDVRAPLLRVARQTPRPLHPVPAGFGGGEQPRCWPRGQSLPPHSKSHGWRALTRYMPWLAKTFLQGALSLARCCCRHCWTAVSSPSCFRQKREASREQDCCSCGVPGWPLCAHAEHKPTDKNRTTKGNRDILVPPHPSSSFVCGPVSQRQSISGRFTRCPV